MSRVERPEVKEGATYEDRDKRANGRRLLIERIYPMGGDADYARCAVVSLQGAKLGKTVTVLLRRLRSRDYGLVNSATEARA